MADEPNVVHGERRGGVVFLAWIAGFVDGVGYLVLFHMFTSHMSGNTIAGGVHLGRGSLALALHRLLPLPAFVLGVAGGRGLVEFLSLRGLRSPFAVAFAVEALLLGIFLGCGAPVYRDGGLRPGSEGTFYLLATLPALAMGVQNATLRRIYGKTIRTTYISGALTDISEGVVDYLYWLGGARPAESRPSLGHLALLLTVWVGYFLGAVLGALAEQRWLLTCLLLPIGGLVLLALVDLVVPFSRPPERTVSPIAGTEGT